MKIDNRLIVRPNGEWVENLTHEYLTTKRIAMLHIVNTAKPDKSLCGRNVELWDIPYRVLNSRITRQLFDEAELTEKEFCKRCLKKYK
jgi:hypothetical protein